MLTTFIGLAWVTLPQRHDFVWRPRDGGIMRQALDVNYRGANHVWDGQWNVGRFDAASRGAVFVRAQTATRLNRGDYVVLIDPKMGQDRAEFNRIESVEPDRIRLDRPLADNFGNGILVQIPSDRVARNITLDGWQLDADNTDNGIWALFVDGLTLRNVSVGNAASSAIRFDFCRNITVENSAVWDGSKRTQEGRGLDFYNCVGIQVRGVSARGLRHAFQFSNTHDFKLERLTTTASQDASLDFHGRNSGNGSVVDSLFDGSVKIGNPSFTRGDRHIVLERVKTDAWYQIHGGSAVTMTECLGRNLIATGYTEDAWPTIAATNCQFVLPNGPWLYREPQVCFNVNGVWPQVTARFVDCEFRSEVTGRWTREIFLENLKPGSKVELIRSKASRIQVNGLDPIVRQER
jgi:hypothetical protein